MNPPTINTIHPEKMKHRTIHPANRQHHPPRHTMKTLTRKQAEKNIRAIDTRIRSEANSLADRITACHAIATIPEQIELFHSTNSRHAFRINTCWFDAEAVAKQIKRNASVSRTASGKCPAAGDAKHGRQDALRLYGTEQAAARIIRRQVEDMGGDLDPAVAKRALSLVADLEQGHTFYPAPEITKNPKTGRWEEMPTDNWKTTSETIDINVALGRTGDSWSYTVTTEELDKLRTLGFIINTTHPATP